MRVYFGDLALDRAARQLLRGEQEIHLAPKAFDLLVLLVEQRPLVVPKEKIKDRLWPSTFVSESTLLTVVTDLRAALGDDSKRPRYVRTVRGFGYAFCGKVGEGVRGAESPESAAPTRELRLILEDREIPLQEGENLLGRMEGGAAWIDSDWVSRRHARIVVSGDVVCLEDLGSKNGTFLRGRRISAPERLSNGDQICLGRVPMTFRILRVARPTRTDDQR